MTVTAKDIEGLTKSMGDITKKLETLETERREDSSSISAILKGTSAPIVGGTSDEQRAMKYFGCDHPAKLLGINTSAPRFKGVPEEYKQIVREFKKAVDVSRWTAQMFYDEPKDRIGATADQDRVAKVKGILSHNYGREELAPRLKAFGSTVVGGGDEWVPTIISSQYIEEYQLDRVVEDKFKEIAITSSPYDMPTQSGTTKARIIGENSALTSSNFNTGKITFNPVKLAEYYVLPTELNEDSAVAFYDIATSECMQAQRRAVEAAILNGDKDGTHIDSDTQAAGGDVAEKAWNGLRREALSNTAFGGTTDFGNAAISETSLRIMRQRMKKYGVNPKELMWITDPVALNQMLLLPSVVTMEKYGSMATVVSGELARYQGIPIITSEYMRSDLNATGIYDGLVLNRTGLLLVNMSRWWIGMRRPIRMKVMEDLANQDRWLIASYQRKDFKGFAQSASEISVSYGYNIAV